MKLWYGILLAVLLVVMPVLSACGPSEADIAYQKAYREALEAYQEQMEAYKERTETYQKNLEEGLIEYFEEYEKYKKKLMEQQLQQLQQQAEK